MSLCHKCWPNVLVVPCSSPCCCCCWTTEKNKRHEPQSWGPTKLAATCWLNQWHATTTTTTTTKRHKHQLVSGCIWLLALLFFIWFKLVSCAFIVVYLVCSDNSQRKSIKSVWNEPQTAAEAAAPGSGNRATTQTHIQTRSQHTHTHVRKGKFSHKQIIKQKRTRNKKKKKTKKRRKQRKTQRTLHTLFVVWQENFGISPILPDLPFKLFKKRRKSVATS